MHVIQNPAYNILLDCPCNILMQSIVKNFSKKNQTITIWDPNSKQVSMILTLPQGKAGFHAQQSTVNKNTPTVSFWILLRSWSMIKEKVHLLLSLILSIIQLLSHPMLLSLSLQTLAYCRTISYLPYILQLAIHPTHVYWFTGNMLCQSLPWLLIPFLYTLWHPLQHQF